MHTFIVMDHTGDSRHHFDPNDYVEVLDAQRRFRELTEAGYTAAKKTGNGTSEVIRTFDPTANETLFIPRACRRMTPVVFLAVPMALITALTLTAMIDNGLPKRELRRRAEEKGLSLLRSWMTPDRMSNGAATTSSRWSVAIPARVTSSRTAPT
jgi:hypothetical protein